jgi:hypothetical protein
MGFKLKDLDKVEAWKGGAMLPLGWHTVTIESADDSEKSSGGHDQVELRFTGKLGDIREWMVFTPNSLGKAVALLNACGIEVKGGNWEFPTGELPGKALSIFVGEEDDRKKPGQKRRRVQAFEAAGKGTPLGDGASSNGAGGDGDDLPF